MPFQAACCCAQWSLFLYGPDTSWPWHSGLPLHVWTVAQSWAAWAPMRQTALRITVGWQGKQLRDSGVHQQVGAAVSGWGEATMAAGMAILASPCLGKNLQEGSPPQGWGKAKGYPKDTAAPCRQKIWIEHINIPRFPAWFSIKINPFCNTAREWFTEKFIVWSIKELNHYYSVNIY